MSSKKLKKLREINNLSQIAMAEKLFMSQSAYSKLENGQTSFKIDIIIKLLETFDLEAAELFEFKKFKLVSIKEWELSNSKTALSMNTFYQHYKKALDEVISKKDNEIKILNKEIDELKNDLYTSKKKRGS
ncbi:MAG: helix-turn-helix domain-containing protein [Sediminibacterium sp.]|nr:helix-turn-helix domain-containing protein [Sediminibacterium sp.]